MMSFVKNIGVKTRNYHVTWCRRHWYMNTLKRLKHDMPERTSQIHIQMLSKKLHEQIFTDEHSASTQSPNLKLVEKHLHKHGLWNRKTTTLKDVDLKLAPLQGGSIEEHFENIGNSYIGDYKSLAEDLASAVLPLPPKEWAMSKGWTKYSVDGASEPVLYPEEGAIVFDIECLVKEGNFPTLATAVSSKHWYSWVSDAVIEDKFRWSKEPSLSDLIPLETKRGQVSAPGGQWQKKLVVGHNVGFDRSFVKEQYFIQGTKTRFLDTMSMHIAICGLTNFQRILYQASSGKSCRKEVLEHKNKQQRWHSDTSDDWKRISTMNNLNDVYQLHCKGEPLDKSTREVFMEGNMADVREQFQELMRYCASDVKATHAVFQKLWPQYLVRFPHPVTLAGMLEMGTAYLPINANWSQYIQQSNTTYTQMQRELKNLLITLANDACALLEKDRYKDDPWLWDLDWSVKKYRLKKTATKSKPDTKEDPSEEEVFTNTNGIPMLTPEDAIIEVNMEEVN